MQANICKLLSWHYNPIDRVLQPSGANLTRAFGGERAGVALENLIIGFGNPYLVKILRICLLEGCCTSSIGLGHFMSPETGCIRGKCWMAKWGYATRISSNSKGSDGPEIAEPMTAGVNQVPSSSVRLRKPNLASINRIIQNKKMKRVAGTDQVRQITAMRK